MVSYKLAIVIFRIHFTFGIYYIFSIYFQYILRYILSIHYNFRTHHIFMAQWLRRCIPNPEVLGFKSAGCLQGQLSLSYFRARFNEQQELVPMHQVVRGIVSLQWLCSLGNFELHPQKRTFFSFFNKQLVYKQQ